MNLFGRASSTHGRWRRPYGGDLLPKYFRLSVARIAGSVAFRSSLRWCEQERHTTRFASEQKMRVRSSVPEGKYVRSQEILQTTSSEVQCSARSTTLKYFKVFDAYVFSALFGRFFSSNSVAVRRTVPYLHSSRLPCSAAEHFDMCRATQTALFFCFFFEVTESLRRRRENFKSDNSSLGGHSWVRLVVCRQWLEAFHFRHLHTITFCILS